MGCCHAAKGTGWGYQPGVTSPKADSLVRSDRPPRRTASFRSPACTRGSHTARQRESGSAPSAPSKSRPSRIPSLLLTLLRVFPGEADSPATFALDQRSPPQIVRFKQPPSGASQTAKSRYDVAFRISSKDPTKLEGVWRLGVNSLRGLTSPTRNGVFG